MTSLAWRTKEDLQFQSFWFHALEGTDKNSLQVGMGLVPFIYLWRLQDRALKGAFTGEKDPARCIQARDLPGRPWARPAGLGHAGVTSAASRLHCKIAPVGGPDGGFAISG